VTSFIPPQLLAPARQLPTGPIWRYELKYDGYRAQVHVTAHGVRILTRTGLDWTDRFPQLIKELAAAVHVPCILDGEVFAPDSNGRPDFTLLCNRLNGAGHVHFVAFDLLAIDGQGTAHLPLSARRDRLSSVLSSSPAVHAIEQTTEPGGLLAFAREQRWEGLVAKTDDGPYQAGVRSPSWRKFKLRQRRDFVIAGWRPDPATGALKSLVLATFEYGQLTLRGSVGTGFTLDERRELPSRFVPGPTRSGRPSSPPFIPLEPTLVAEIEYLELSPHGILRQPTFLGLRADKQLHHLHLEALQG
jgi:bifunctional non-homologous end joining protein LigD